MKLVLLAVLAALVTAAVLSAVLATADFVGARVDWASMWSVIATWSLLAPLAGGFAIALMVIGKPSGPVLFDQEAQR